MISIDEARIIANEYIANNIWCNAYGWKVSSIHFVIANSNDYLQCKYPRSVYEVFLDREISGPINVVPNYRLILVDAEDGVVSIVNVH